jgi:hypothetical protein
MKLLLGGLLLVLSSAHFQAQTTLNGKWVWTGTRGWQRFTLDLTASGNKLTGSIILGPGSKVSTAADWEYFFEPAVFSITNGIISGNRFTFEQILPGGPPRSPAGGPARHSGPRAIPERLVYSGEIQGNSILITREEPARLNDPFVLGSHRVRFTVHRSESTPDNVSFQAKSADGLIDASVLPVSLDLEVQDGAGAAALALTKGDFVIREDGEVRPILNLIPPEAPQNVLLLFDHNLNWLRDDSRREDRVDVNGAWNRLLQAALSFVARLRAQDHIAMAVFEDTTKPVLGWRGAKDGPGRVNIGDVLRPPTGQKDVYGMLRWSVTQFSGMNGRKSMVIFTDGRDGRFSPRWFRDSRQREVLDPFFGLVDEGEAEEFAAVLTCVKQSGVKLHFIVINSDQDPEFGPAVVGRRISGLYPGSTEGIRQYVAGVQSRLKQLAEISGGRVLYGNTPQDALTLYRDLHLELGIGKAYTLEFLSARPADGSFRSLEASVSNKAYRVTQYRTGYTAN